MNLFEINDSIKQIVDRDDIDSEALKDTLDALELTRDEKLDGLAGLIERDTADIDFLTNKIKQLTEQKRHFQNQKDNLLKYMTEVIDDAGVKQVQTKHYILKPRNYRQKTIISDELKLPDTYREKKEVVSINKQLLYNDLKKGVEIPGAHLEPNRKTTIN
ncbi:MAG: siphovirus Gp157 family protein [Lactobacillus sp.]|nr:siphovirus Gp157 family protein [Lactobacillus sp.]